MRRIKKWSIFRGSRRAVRGDAKGQHLVLRIPRTQLVRDVLLGPDDHRRARPRESCAERAFGEVGAQLEQMWSRRSAVGLVQAVLVARREQARVTRRDLPP